MCISKERVYTRRDLNKFVLSFAKLGSNSLQAYFADAGIRISGRLFFGGHWPYRKYQSKSSLLFTASKSDFKWLNYELKSHIAYIATFFLLKLHSNGWLEIPNFHKSLSWSNLFPKICCIYLKTVVETLNLSQEKSDKMQNDQGQFNASNVENCGTNGPFYLIFNTFLVQCN